MVQPPTWPLREPSDLNELKSDDPTWALFVFWVPLTTAHAVQPPCLTVLRTLWSESTHFGQSPSAFMQFFPSSFHLGWSMLFVYCAFIVYCLHLASHSVSNGVLFSYSNILAWLLIANYHHYCSISVWLLFIILNWKCIPGIFRSHNRKTVPVIVKYSLANKHQTSQDSPTYVLA